MEENKQNKIINHDVLKWIIIGIVGFVVLALVFGVGMFVGGMKARFSYRWAENYHKNFAGPRGGFLENWQMPPAPDDFIESYGTFGQIIKIDGTTLVIRGRDNVEKIVLINNETVIQRFKETLKPSDLKVNDPIVVIGESNDAGQIVAKLIRLFPIPTQKESFRPSLNI